MKVTKGIRITSLIVSEADWPEKKSYSQIWIRMFALIQGHCIANWLIWSTCRGNIVQLLLMNQSTKIILIHIELSIPYFFSGNRHPNQHSKCESECLRQLAHTVQVQQVLQGEQICQKYYTQQGDPASAVLGPWLDLPRFWDFPQAGWLLM